MTDSSIPQDSTSQESSIKVDTHTKGVITLTHSNRFFVEVILKRGLVWIPTSQNHRMSIDYEMLDGVIDIFQEAKRQIEAARNAPHE